MPTADRPAATGTGPFVFKEWVTGDHVTLTKNPNYWNASAGGPYLDAVTFKPIADPTATLNALQAGDIDISQTLSAGGRSDDQGRHEAAVTTTAAARATWASWR